MAITTFAGVVSGMQAPVSYVKTFANLSGGAATMLETSWYNISTPIAGAADTNGITGSTLSSTSAQVNGQIPFYDPPSGNAYLARFNVNCSGGGQRMAHFMLCDRLWHNSAINIAIDTAQTINSVTWPARDENGSTNGVGVLVALEVTVATGAQAVTVTLGYTNSNGVAGRTTTFIHGQGIASCPVAACWPFGLQAGDVGIRSIQSLTILGGGSGWNTGTVNLVAYRPIAVLSQNVLGITNMNDAITLGMPRVRNGTVPFLIGGRGAQIGSAPIGMGEIAFTQG